MFKIYIASSLHNSQRVAYFRDLFRIHNIEITYDWTTHGQVTSPRLLKEFGEAELKGVLDADLLFMVQPGRNGSHVELGIMIACAINDPKKDIVILEDQPVEMKTFYFLPQVNRFQTESAAVSYILGKANECH